MTREDVTTKLRKFIAENFLYMRPDFELSDDDSLLETGIVDSMGVMEVLAFLDEEFGVEVPDDDVTEENLGTVSSIVEYVARRRNPVSA